MASLRRWSGERGDAGVGGDDGRRVGPALEDAHDVGSGVADEAGGGVPEPPAQRLGLGPGEPPVEAEELEPEHQKEQLDTDDDAGWMWGDVGTLYFTIRQSTPLPRALDEAWLVLQCGWSKAS